MTTITIQGQTLDLLPEKAVIWRDRSCLILADLHLGKITHFRKSGMPLPRQAESENYDRLSTILLNEPLERVLILGDLFHSTMNSEWDMFTRFLDEFKAIRFELVHGNHDILPEEAYNHENFRAVGDLVQEAPFAFTHKPTEEPKLYNVCGHIHPGIKLKGQGRQNMRLPCFYFGKKGAILPAFGTFTGLHCLQARKMDRIFVISDQTVLELK